MKVGQGDLLFVCNQGSLVGQCVITTRLLQVSAYNGYDLCHPVCPKIWFVHFDPSDLEK